MAARLWISSCLLLSWSCWSSVSQELGLAPCAGPGLKYLRGDALHGGSTNCLGPDNTPYPTDAVTKAIPSSRKGRSGKVVDPMEMQRNLLRFYQAANNYPSVALGSHREAKELLENGTTIFGDAQSRRRPASNGGASSASASSCSGPGGRLCKTRYNTTAPLYGVSLTSGQPVTIVQKFPDLLQQVIFEVCDSKECDVVHGECVQTYVPYLFLVIPLGPVTLTGQDYVLVENGCVCRPKYSKNGPEASLYDALPSFGIP